LSRNDDTETSDHKPADDQVRDDKKDLQRRETTGCWPGWLGFFEEIRAFYVTVARVPFSQQPHFRLMHWSQSPEAKGHDPVMSR
jgi:hypothetical protein